MPQQEIHPLRLLIRKLETHQPLAAEDRQAVLDLPYKRRTVEANAYLLREGDRPERCAVLISGYAFRHKVTGDGARQILCEFGIRLTAQGLEPTGAFELPMTQEQLADATGLTPVHVNRVLKALQAEGLLDRDRRSIRFPQWRRLRDVADFSTRYLHFSQIAEAAI